MPDRNPHAVATENDIFARIKETGRPEAEEIPKGYHPAAYWQENLQCSQGSVYRLLRQAVKEGLLECDSFRQKRGGHPIRFWREVKKDE